MTDMAQQILTCGITVSVTLCLSAAVGVACEEVLDYNYKEFVGLLLIVGVIAAGLSIAFAIGSAL